MSSRRLRHGARRLIASVAAVGVAGSVLVAPASAVEMDWTVDLAGVGEVDAVRVVAHGEHVYVAGHVQGTIGGQTRIGYVDVWVQKLDRAGTVLWTRQFGTTGSEWVGGLAVDGSGPYVAGETDGSFAGATSAGGHDAFLVKFDSDGNLLWSRQFGTPRLDRFTGIALAPGGQLYGVGGTAAPDPRSPSGFVSQAFVRSYTPAGAVTWSHQFGAMDTRRNGPDYVTAVDVAADVVGPVVVGWADGSIVPDQVARSNADTWERRYDDRGAVVWTRHSDLTGTHAITGEPVEIINTPHAVGLDAAGLTVTGAHGSANEPYTRRMDLQGRVLWEGDYAGAAAVDGACTGFALAGTDDGPLAEPPRRFGAYAARFTGSGEQLWRVDQPGDEGEWVFVDVATTESAAYVVRRHTTFSPTTQSASSLLALRDLPPSDCPQMGATGPVTVAGGATYTRAAAVAVAASAPNAYYVRLSNNGSDWATYPYASPLAWSLTDARYGPTGDGRRTVWAQLRGATGEWSALLADTIVLDTVAPATRAPQHRFVVPATAGTSAIPLRLDWAGSDATSGIARYQLEQSTDGATYTPVSLPSATTASITRSLPTGHTYRFRSRAIDRAGNVGAWAYGASFRLSTHQETSSAVTYAGRWPITSYSYASGGAYRSATVAGAVSRFRFTGRSATWIAGTGPTRGSADVRIDGRYVKTVNLYSETVRGRQMIYSYTWPAVGEHVMEVVVKGTVGHPEVVVDAFAAY